MVRIGRVARKRGVDHRRVASEFVADHGRGARDGDGSPSSLRLWRIGHAHLGHLAVSPEESDEPDPPCVPVLAQCVAQGVAHVAFVECGREGRVDTRFHCEFVHREVEQAAARHTHESRQVPLAVNSLDSDRSHAPLALELQPRLERRLVCVTVRDPDAD